MVEESPDAVFQLVKVVVEELALYDVRGVDVGEFPWCFGRRVGKVPGKNAGGLQRKIIDEYVFVPSYPFDLLVAHFVARAMGTSMVGEEGFDEVHRLVKRDGGDPVGEIDKVGGHEVVEKSLVVIRKFEVRILTRHAATP